MTNTSDDGKALSAESDSSSAALLPGGQWIDISTPLRSGMAHWPGDPPVQIDRAMDIQRGDSHTLSQITMGSHAGTHMDAPAHFISKATSIDRMPLDVAIGPARVIEISDSESIKPDILSSSKIRSGERVLFKTRNSSKAWGDYSFAEDFVFISREAAQFLAERQVKLVGVDYLSVGGYKRDGAFIHRTLLQAGVWIIEGLDLSAVSPGRYELICLPLKIEQGDGAPARAVLRSLRVGERARR